MHVFLPTFYSDNREMNSIQACLCLFKLLLQFHEPKLQLFLDQHNISPVMYAYNWFITMFASKLELDPLYRLWKKLVRERDILMIFYLSVALVAHHKTQILTKTNTAELPTLMTSLTMVDGETVDLIFEKAKKIKDETPYSFMYLILNEGVLKKTVNAMKLQRLVTRLETLPALPMSPKELLFYCYPGKINCSNPFC